MKHLQTLAWILDVADTGSVRQAARHLDLTPSSLTRKIQDFEEELGTRLFDRTTQGLRLSPAGSLFVQHARGQFADLDRVREAIAELSDLRRGHVSLACSQAFVDTVIPDAVGAFRAQCPDVSFAVRVRDHAQATAALIAYEVELALILQPPPLPDLQVLLTSEQPVCAIMDGQHPLAGMGPVRLRTCLGFPVAMPDRSLSVRHSLDAAILRSGCVVNAAVEASSIEFLRNYVRRESLVSFQVSVGIPADHAGLCVRPIDRQDLPPMLVVLAQLQGRTLSVAAARFADQVRHSLDQNDGMPHRMTASHGRARPARTLDRVDAERAVPRAAARSPAPDRPPLDQHAADLLARAEDYMRTHAGRPIRMEQVAASAECSVRMLNAAYHRFRGTTPVSVLRTIRLENARAELMRSEAPVAVVAARHGFTNASRFARAYREQFGEGPSETGARR